MAETQKKGLNKWTVMCFIAGDNNLSASMISQLKAITDAGYQEDTSVLVYFDPNTSGASARRFDVNGSRKKRGPKTDIGDIGDGDNSFVQNIGDGENPFVRNIANQDCTKIKQPEPTGAPDTHPLSSFLDFAIEKHTAENYMLFLIGHGTIVANDAFLPDTEADSVTVITLNKLGEILKEFTRKAKAANGKFQLVGFHSCSMSAVEVAYELKDTANYMMGTQGFAFVGSWPYRQLLKKLFRVTEDLKSTNGRAATDSNAIVRDLLDSLQGLSFHNAKDFALAGYSHDLSMCSLNGDKVERLTDPLKQLSLALKDGLLNARATEFILLAHWKSQSYFNETYTDLVDFCKCLSELCTENTAPQIAIRNACNMVTKTLEVTPSLEADPWRFDRLVVYSDYFGPEYQYSHGLSIYFPWASPSVSVLERYRRYAFTSPQVSQGSDEPESPDSWLSFLKEYFRITQRGIRGQTGVRATSVYKQDAEPAGNNGELTPTLAGVGGSKPTPTLAGVGDSKPTPTLAGVGDSKPTPTLAGVGDSKPTPTLAGVGDSKPTPTLAGIGDSKPTPTLAGVGDSKPTPTLAVGGNGNTNSTLAAGDSKPTPTLAGVGDSKPTPTLAVGSNGITNSTLAAGDSKPTPTLGGGVFGFTVIKNYPAPTDEEITSRPRKDTSNSRARGAGCR